MKRFVLETLLFSAAVLATLAVVLLTADGYSDPFYLRFTTPAQSSLILGTSRAAQGIQPEVLNKTLGRNDFFNYAFTRNYSPYGPVYLSSIKRKLDPKTRNGIFIITVDSWGLSSDTRDPNDTRNFEERNTCVASVADVNANPNFDYLFNVYAHPCHRFIFKDKSSLLHDDGWLEVNLDANSISEAIISAKVSDYRNEILPFYNFSAARFRYLQRTVGYLKQFGKVYLVRLPVHPKMMALDEKLVPQLSPMIARLSRTYDVPFLDLSTQNSQYRYTDGNHLCKESGRSVSLRIANWIRETTAPRIAK